MWAKSFFLSFLAVFVALDVIGGLPMYLSMTRSMLVGERKKVLDQSMIIAFVVAMLFAFLGEHIFRYLGIQIFDFKIAGGLILLLVSLTDLVGNPEVKDRASGSSGIVPIAVPLITGPGVLTTVILQVNLAGYLITTLAVFLNYVIAWKILKHSDLVSRLIGKDGTVVISKIAALLLVAISVAMMRGGVFEAIHAFADPGMIK